MLERIVDAFGGLIKCSAVEELDVSESSPVIIEPGARILDTHSECSIGNLHNDAVGITSGLECVAAALYSMRYISQELGLILIIDFQVSYGSILAYPTVLQIYSLRYGNHLLDDSRQIHFTLVGIDRSCQVGAIAVTCAHTAAWAECTIDLELIDTILQVCESLVHVECLGVTFGCTNLAIGARASGCYAFPSLKSIGEVGIDQHVGDFGILLKSFCNGLLGPCIYGSSFSSQLLCVEHVLCHDVRVRAIDEVFVGLYVLSQVRFQFLSRGARQACLCQIIEGLLHLGIIVGICLLRV